MTMKTPEKRWEVVADAFVMMEQAVSDYRSKKSTLDKN